MPLDKLGSFMDLLSPIGISSIGGGVVGAILSMNAHGTFLYGILPATILAVITSLIIFTAFSRVHLYFALSGFEDLTGFCFGDGV